ncbi:hypothetical protein AAVH_20081 [Aphelenchoides avenae]|nr:hypothetical protein AAVH_20081 [Aphelenchus avenae]
MFVKSMKTRASGTAGEILLKKNDTWTYCGLIPTQANGQVLIPAAQFGFTPGHNWADTYQTTFGQNNEMYQVLTMCTYSEYNVDGGLGGIFMPRDDEHRYVFKCVCNFDKCNSQATFGAYMASLKAASVVKSR